MQKVFAAFKLYFWVTLMLVVSYRSSDLICPKLEACIITIIFWKLEAKKKNIHIFF